MDPKLLDILACPLCKRAPGSKRARKPNYVPRRRPGVSCALMAIPVMLEP